MNSNLQDLPSSPTEAGNFIISYEFQDHQCLTKQDTDKLLDFIDADKEVNVIFTNSDKSFFPRAFTDKDLNDFDDFNGLGAQNKKEIVKPKVIKASNKFITGTETGFNKMNPAYNTSFGNASYQPDLVMISSNQRPGPDGSPALVPSGSQGFLPSGNMSETSELFAPVRQLTFSDIDQNSQIEDSYARRSVSTPTRHRGMNGSENNNVNMNGIQGRESDSCQEDSSDEREMSPEFRQLDGEADSQAEMMGSGAFDPTAMGINKEFLDNFTGRTPMGRMHLSSSVFSPLGSRDMGLGFRHENGEGQANRTITPPLHSPRLDSPHQTRSPHNSPRPPGHYVTRTTAHQHVSDQQELQFSMSPTRNPPNFMPVNVQHNEYNVDILSSHNQGDLYNQYDFHRHLESPRNIAVPLQIRQSVSVGEERRIDSQVVTSSQGLSRSISKNSSQDNKEINEMIESDNNHAEGQDEVELNGNNNANVDDKTEENDGVQYYSNVPAAEFEQRYLQRTHVSVKVPQATYDSMAGEYAAQSAGSYDSVGQQLDEYAEENWEDENESEEQSSETSQKSGHAIGGSNYEINEQKQVNEKSKGAGGQSDLGQKKSKKQTEKFHFEMRKMAENQNVNAHSEKSRDLSKNVERTNIKQANTVVHGSSGSLTSGVNNKSQNTQSKINGQPQSVPAPQAASGLHPSSRLLQETVSQKNKTSQKFISNVPQRNISDQNACTKEFKKPYDVNKNPTLQTCAGARKTLLDNSTDKGPKLKIRSTMGSIPQKQKQSNTNLSSVGKANVPASEAQKVNQSRGPGPASQGTSLNNSRESVEGEGNQGRGRPVVTMVEKTSPVVDKTRSAQGAQVWGRYHKDLNFRTCTNLM